MKQITDMKTESITFMVTYKGDITAKLKACGTKCPFRLNAMGDTEQLIESLGGNFGGMDMPRVRAQMETMLLQDCRKNGRVLCHSWITLKNSDKQETVALPLPDVGDAN